MKKLKINYVANFLSKSCEVINEEINEQDKKKKLPFTFNIDFLNIPKGEEGVKQLNDKLGSYSEPFLRTVIPIPKYNSLILII